MSRMYSEVTPWNVFKGCRFDCIYCKPSFQAQAKRQKHNCEKCYKFEPHEHPERLAKVPKAHVVWPGSSGDISFAIESYLMAMIKYTYLRPEQTYYWQSKNPKCMQTLLPWLKNNHILLTTLETNRDKDYHLVSKAPYPTDRAYDFMKLPWHRKIVTIEPVIDFDSKEFLRIILDIHPEMVWYGYNSRPKQVKLIEPTYDKTMAFIAMLRGSGIPVKTKFLPWEEKIKK